MSQDILQLVETFLAHCDDKLEELAQKNQKIQVDYQKGEEETCDTGF